MEIEIGRKRIIEGDFIYPTDLITLIPSRHFKQRITERGFFADVIPTAVRVTKNNIYCAKTMDGKHLHSVVIRLNYNKSTWLFICLNPFDGAAKTLWFEDKKKEKYENRNSKKDSQQAVPDDR